MPHRLLIRLLADGASEWLAQARDGAVLQGPQAGLPDAVAADEVVLLLPAEQVLLLETPRIGRTRAQLAQALPFAIEEQLVAPVETQQVAFDERSAGPTLAVAVVSRDVLDAALARLHGAGLAPDRAYAETQLLPCDPPTALVDGGRVLLRWARGGALACSADALPETLDLLRDAEVDVARLQLIGPDDALPGVPVASRTVVDQPLRAFAAQLRDVDAANLLQGDYRPPRRHAQALGLWRWAAGLAALALLAGISHALIERAQLERQVGERQAQMEQLLRRAVPGVQRIVDPVAQLRVEQQRIGQAAGGGALPLLARVAPLIAGSGRYTLESLDYRGETLELVITADDVAALDQLRERIAGLPLRVELSSAVPGTRGVEGRLRIRGASA